MFKKTVFWVLILALLGGLFYLIDKRSEEKKVATEVHKRLFSFSPSEIMGFTGCLCQRETQFVVNIKQGLTSA